MYDEQLKKLQNVGMMLTVPKEILQLVLEQMDKYLGAPKAQRRGDVDIYDLDVFFLFVKDQNYRDFFIRVFELEFNDHVCSLITMRSMIKAMIESRWQVHHSVYYSARRYRLIHFYGIV